MLNMLNAERWLKDANISNTKFVEDTCVLIAENECVEEPKPTEDGGTVWRMQNTLWMLVFALLLWVITYLIVITATLCFKSMDSIGSVWYYDNLTSLFYKEDAVVFAY